MRSAGEGASDDEIIAAAKAARAHGFIKRLKDGYDTVIGDDDLSEGERQLLCIARVMLLRPPVLILDEATSSIDTRTEVKVQDAFTRLMQGRTSFVVAHRLSTVRDADCIIVMKDGAVFEAEPMRNFSDAADFIRSFTTVSSARNNDFGGIPCTM